MGARLAVPADSAHEFLKAPLRVQDPIFLGWCEHFRTRQVPVKIVHRADGHGMIYTHRSTTVTGQGIVWCCGYEPELSGDRVRP